VIRAIVFLLALEGLARAEAVKPPVGWGIDHEMADALATRASGVPHFGDQKAIAVARVFRAPGQPVTLFVTRVEANVTTGRDIAATAELDEVRGAVRRAGVKPESESQRADVVTKQLEAAVAWRDVSLGIVTSSRIVIAADAQRLVAVLGECVSPIESDATKLLVATCNLALATLETDIAPASRVPLAIVDVTKGVDPQAVIAAGSGRGNPFEAPRLDATGPRPAMPPMSVPADRETDRRPIYIGGGIVVLALMFWWNRKRRDRFEREDASPTKAAADDDADDLHAAAEPDEIESLQKALADDPKNLTYHDQLGERYETEKRWAELVAILEAKADLVSEPNESAALVLRSAEIKRDQLGDLDGALASYRRVLDLEPDHPEAKTAVTQLEDQKKDKS
jgi:hypothetical protein